MLNPKMNDINSIDYCNKDHTHNHDGILSHHSQEYPRLSTNHKDSLMLENAPWG